MDEIISPEELSRIDAEWCRGPSLTTMGNTERMQAAIRRLRSALRAVEQREAALREAIADLRESHGQDCNLSFPGRPYNASNGCDCGAEYRNAKIDAVLARSALGGPTPDTEGTQ